MAGTCCAYPAVMTLLTCRIWSAATSTRPPGSCSYWSGILAGETAFLEGILFSGHTTMQAAGSVA